MGHNKGSKNPAAKITEKDVVIIRQLKQQGKTHKEVGAIYGISISTVRDITTGCSWGWVD